MLELTDHTKVGEMPVTPDTLQLRYKDTEYPVYKDFVTFFVSGVIGIRHFERKKTTMDYRSYATISDEAFAILSLENNWDRWSAMAETEEWKESDIASKWTTSRDKRTIRRQKGPEENDDDDDTPQATRYRGWSCQGIARYNQLFKDIKVNRATQSFLDFEEYLLKAYQTEEEEEGRRKGKRQKVDTRKQLPEAEHELWDNEEPTSAYRENDAVFPTELGILGQTEGV